MSKQTSPGYRYHGIEAPCQSTLHKTRTALGLTQTELGAQVGVSAATISLYESGKKQLPANILARIAVKHSIPRNTFIEILASNYEAVSKRGQTITTAAKTTALRQLAAAENAANFASTNPGETKLLLYFQSQLLT